MKKMDPTELSDSIVKPVLANMKAMNVKANVVLVLDDSGSMEHEYEEDHVQLLAERGLALAMSWDPDGKIDIFTLNRGYVGSLDLQTFKGWVKRTITDLGGTPYARAISDILARYGQQPGVAQGIAAWFKGFFGAEPQAPVRPIPTYVIFVTDGACQDTEKTTPLMRQNADAPVFWQFMGIGEADLSYIQQLAAETKNASFFHIPCEEDDPPIDDGWLYRNLTKDFNDWLKEARVAGVVAG